ncbi:MAG: ThuA domain-containing protein [Geminicoccaceae bacterium]
MDRAQRPGGWDGGQETRGADLLGRLGRASAGGLLEDRRRNAARGNGFEVAVENTTEVLADPAIHDLSLIVPLFTMATIEKEELDNLCRAVRGVGSAAITAACATPSATPPSTSSCGGQWVAHPGNIIDYRVDVTRPDDPVMQGIQSFPTVPSSITCTSIRRSRCWRRPPSRRARPLTKGVVMPVAWKTCYGLGRVFYSSLGHVAAEFEVPQMRTILARGLARAAR